MESGVALDREVLDDLIIHDLIEDRNPSARSLTGGVSSDVTLIESGRRRFVLKRALARLRVGEAWYADVKRNETECRCLRYLAGIVPDSVPRVRHHNPDLNYFCMDYLGTEYANYKTLLLSGDHRSAISARAARTLALIHRHTWGKDEVEKSFATLDQFWALRLDPYLGTAARRNPALREPLMQEANRLASTGLALVQGDFSPKNLMLCGDRLVVLDCEAAWYGDPAFDVAFFINHFMIKAIHLRQWSQEYINLARVAWDVYANTLGAERMEGMAVRVGRLLPMLMLARVDGKSAVEYLTDESKKTVIRNFCHNQIPQQYHDVSRCMENWRSVLRTP